MIPDFRPIQQRSPAARSASRSGFLTIELVVAAGLMLVVISVITSLSFRIRNVVSDTHEHRLALWTIANELERLTTLSHADVATAVAELQPTPELLNALPDAQWSGQWLNDEQGARVELELNWKRRHPGRPLRLVAWMLPDPQPGQQTPPDDGTNDESTEPVQTKEEAS